MPNYTQADSRQTINETLQDLESKTGLSQLESYQSFCNSLRLLNQKHTELFAQDKYAQFKQLDNNDISELTQLYQDSISLADTFEKQLKDNGLSTDSLDFVKGVMLRDLNHIRKADLNAEPTLPELLNNARSLTLNTKGVKLDTKSGAQSSRIPMTIKDRNGNPIEGFFTPKKILDPMGLLNENIEKLVAADKGKHPEAMLYLTNMLDKFRQATSGGKEITMKDNHKCKCNNDDTDGISFFSAISENREYSPELLTEFIGLVNGTSENELKKIPGFKSAVKDFCSMCNSFHTSMSINTEELQMKPGDRIDSRNCAMSDVARLLNRPDLICQSVPVTVNDGSKKIEGTFIKYADGQDPNGMDSKYAYGTKPDKSRNANLLRDIADMQILDYICGNIDRHNGNFFYKFESMDYGGYEVSGIVGIDNDSSFGTGEEPNFLNKNKMVSIQNMKCVSESMANTLSTIGEEELRFTLRNSKLSEQAIDKACQRLNSVKQAIKAAEGLTPDTDREKLNEAYHKVDGKFLLKFSQKNFQEKSMEYLVSKKAKSNKVKPGLLENMFDRVAAFDVTTIGLDPERETGPNVKSDNRLSVEAFNNIGLVAKKLQDKTVSSTFSKYTSKEYQAVQQALQDVAKVCDFSKKDGEAQRYPDFNSVMLRNKAMNRLTKACNAYFEHKKTSRSGSSYENKRIELVEQIMNFAKKSRINPDSITPEEKAELKSNAILNTNAEGRVGKNKLENLEKKNNMQIQI